MECKHKWELIDRYKKYVGQSSGGIFSDSYAYFTIVYVQKCEVCGKIEQSEVK